MANPRAAHTFDLVKVYLSQRDLAAPGSGTWSAPTTIFDGLTDTAFGTAGTFSAGALSDSDPQLGIVTTFNSQYTGFSGQAFLGNGIPDTPIQINSIVGHGYWDTGYGAWAFGGNLFFLSLSAGKVLMYRSTNSGVTWTAQDTGHGPGAGAGDGFNFAVQRVSNTVYIFAATDGTLTNFAIWGFDLTTSLWSASFAPLNAAGFFNFNDFNGWTNGLFQFTNGDFLVLYNSGGGGTPVLRRWVLATTTWGAEVTLPGESIANAVMDPGFDVVHILTYDTSFRKAQVDYSTYTHSTNTLASSVTTIPASVGNSDGVGHGSIQSGMLFVPRDDFADFDNSVWVATLPVATFSKEELPVPAGETNTISSFVVNPGGTGYVVNDTGTVNGGLAGYLAQYKITSVKNNAVASWSWTIQGTGYAVGNLVQVNNGTTNPILKVTAIGGGGAVTDFVFVDLGAGCTVTSGISTTALTGVGTGLQINILTLFNGVTGLTIAINSGGYPGGGYSVTSSAATTTGGAQPGVGTGLTLNILAVGPKTPSCAYMMFPNGYAFALAPAIDDPITLGGTFGFTSISISIVCPLNSSTGKIGVFFSSSAPVVTGGVPPYTFGISGGPAWLSVDPATGIVSGTPTAAGSFSFTETVTDSLSNSASVADPCPISIAAPCPPSFIPGAP